MNKFESVIITIPTLEEGDIEYIITEVKDLINKHGKVTAIDKKGKKKLAYEIKNHKEGYYIAFDFEVKTEEAISDLERYYRLNENIIKFITVRKDD